MNEKLLVIVYVPLLEREYNMYIPVVKKIGTIKSWMVSAISELNSDEKYKDGSKFLYDKSTGEKYDDNLFVKNSTIQNGSQLILF